VLGVSTAIKQSFFVFSLISSNFPKLLYIQIIAEPPSDQDIAGLRDVQGNGHQKQRSYYFGRP
jgi:hypothetical protein